MKITISRAACALLLLPSSCLGGGGGSGGDSAHVNYGVGEDQLPWSYFEGPVGNGIGFVGPSNWKNLDYIPGNQCGGNGQKDGFGQSPIVVPWDNYVTCDGDKSGYSYAPGDCYYTDLRFEIRKDALYVSTPKDHHCHLGEVTIPGQEAKFYAQEIRLTVGSEHSIQAFESAMELQVLYESKDGHGKVAAFAFPLQILPLDDNGLPDEQQPNPFIDNLLRGWEYEFHQTAQFCAENPNGSGEYTGNTNIVAKQLLVECPANSTDLFGYFAERGYDSSSNPAIGGSFRAPIGQVPNLFEPGTLLNSDTYGFLAYKGSLTKPPCTEKVYWNLVDQQDVFLSLSQISRLTVLTLCRVEETTCNHGSAASEFGKTKRSPQHLQNRTVVHYCGGEHSDLRPIPKESYIKTSADETKKYKPPKEFKDYYAILFPFFAVMVGVIIYYFTSRYLHLFPYTAILFLIGTIIGILIKFFPDYNQFNNSATMNSNIDSHVVLLVFLPGLLFKDAYSLDVHLFRKSFGQILFMGFPMVLAGTSLMGAVAYYILPYDWGLFLCMTFGAIVSATDPVAVSALLNELGAPPRLKMHISGESLLNDGSAVVFFTIFQKLFYYDWGIPDGKDIGWGEGFQIFFQMSLGAAAMGAAFGLALAAILWLLNRRYNKEEAIIQVCASCGMAYLSFYVAEGIYHLSGVIAVVFCGIVTKAAAPTILIDHEMMDSFWNLVEHLLNTVLFALGGMAWGTVISNKDDSRRDFSAADWGYLFVIYFFMSVVRLFVFSAFYPIISKIGLKSNIKEMLFQSFGGLRGAVGIALAISLDSGVRTKTSYLDPRRALTSQVYFFTGGIALLTLFINGTLAGPLLKKFELSRASPERKQITDRYEGHLKRHMLSYLLELLGEQRFSQLDFRIIQKYVKPFESLTCSELKTSLLRLRDSTPSHLYHAPLLDVFDNYFASNQEEFRKVKDAAKVKLSDHIKNAAIAGRLTAAATMPDEIVEDSETKGSQAALMELRLVYVELLRKAYDEDIKRGEIAQQPLAQWLLSASVAITEDQVTNGKEIKDWEATRTPFKNHYNKFANKDKAAVSEVMLAMFFLSAHQKARDAFVYKFCDQGCLSAAERKLMEETDAQVLLAQETIDAQDPEKVQKVASYLLCSALLNNACITVSEFTSAGLLKDSEAEHWIEELEHQLEHLDEIFQDGGNSAHASSIQSAFTDKENNASGALTDKNNASNTNLSMDDVSVEA